MIEETQSFDATDFLVADGLSLAYHTFEAGIPQSVAQASAHVKKIDLTETNIRNFDNLRFFTKVETVILDKNGLSDLSTCPALPTLHTLWVNNNNISDLPAFFDDVSKKFPALQYLSMMRNPGCPGLMDIVNPDLEAIRLYRLYVLYRVPQLLVLDWENVTKEEREEARRRGQYAIKRKSSTSSTPLPVVPVSSSPTPNPTSPDGSTSNSGSSTGLRSGVSMRTGSKNSEGNRFIGNAHL